MGEAKRRKLLGIANEFRPKQLSVMNAVIEFIPKDEPSYDKMMLKEFDTVLQAVHKDRGGDPIIYVFALIHIEGYNPTLSIVIPSIENNVLNSTCCFCLDKELTSKFANAGDFLQKSINQKLYKLAEEEDATKFLSTYGG